MSIRADQLEGQVEQLRYKNFVPMVHHAELGAALHQQGYTLKREWPKPVQQGYRQSRKQAKQTPQQG